MQGIQFGFLDAASTKKLTLKPIYEDIDILKMFFKAKFQKKLNGETRFCREGPNFVYFSIVDQSFLPQGRIEKLHKIWSL